MQNSVENPINFYNSLCLAPMVRVSHLAMRSLFLSYGRASHDNLLVWSEELVDLKIRRCVRVVNTDLGVTDFVDNKTVIFRTDPKIEKHRLVFQLGTSSAESALDAAQVVQNDVAAIDINMGCPKKFSTQGGMGAMLLSKPDVATSIIRTLRSNIALPVTAKIRLLDTIEETISFMRQLVDAGVCAITVHLRQRGVESTVPAAGWEVMKQLVDAIPTIPIIANGDMYTLDMINEMKSRSGCAGAMVARPSLLNISFIRASHDSLNGQAREPSTSSVPHDEPLPNPQNPDTKCAPLPLYRVFQDYLRQCIIYEPVYQVAKYTLMEMMISRRHTPVLLDRLQRTAIMEFGRLDPQYDQVSHCQSIRQLCDVFGIADEYDAHQSIKEAAKKKNNEVTAMIAAGGVGIGISIGTDTGTAAGMDLPAHNFSDSYFHNAPSIPLVQRVEKASEAITVASTTTINTINTIAINGVLVDSTKTTDVQHKEHSDHNTDNNVDHNVVHKLDESKKRPHDDVAAQGKDAEGGGVEDSETNHEQKKTCHNAFSR